MGRWFHVQCLNMNIADRVYTVWMISFSWHILKDAALLLMPCALYIPPCALPIIPRAWGADAFAQAAGDRIMLTLAHPDAATATNALLAAAPVCVHLGVLHLPHVLHLVLTYIETNTTYTEASSPVLCLFCPVVTDCNCIPWHTLVVINCVKCSFALTAQWALCSSYS